MNSRFRTAAAGVAAAALVATSVIGLSSASAEVFDITGPIAGGLTINGNAATLPAGSSVAGTFDDESGVLDLDVTVPAGTLTTMVGEATAVVSYELTTDGVDGTVDGDGNVAATANFQLAITTVSLDGGDPLALAPCTFGPIEMSFTGTLTETELTLSDPGFVIPASTDLCGGVAALINAQVAGENNSAELSVAIGADVPETTTTTTMVEETTTTTTVDETTTTTTAAAGNSGGVGPAAGAKPVAGSANYTG